MPLELVRENSSGVVIGAGPIAATSFEVESRLDEIGAVTATLPAAAAYQDETDATATLLTQRAIIAARAPLYVGAAYTYAGRGIIDEISQSADNRTTTAKGRDLLAELEGRLIPKLDIATTDDPLAAVLVYMSGWTIVGSVSAGVKLQLRRQNAFEALKKIADLTGDHFRYEPSGATTRRIVWLSAGVAFVDSGLRAVGEGDPAQFDTDTCLIGAGATATVSTADLYTRIYPVGGGNEDAALTLLYSTRNSAPGNVSGDYTALYGGGVSITMHIDHDHPENCYIRHDDAYADFDAIDYPGEFNDISPHDSSDAAYTVASDQLFDAALQALLRAVEPTITPKIPVSLVRQDVQPGQKIYADYEGKIRLEDAGGNLITVKWFTLADYYLVLGVGKKTGGDGTTITDLTITSIERDQWPRMGGDVLLDQLQQARQERSHRQTASDVIAATTTRRGGILAGPNLGVGVDGTVFIGQPITFNGELVFYNGDVVTVGVS